MEKSLLPRWIKGYNLTWEFSLMQINISYPTLSETRIG